MPKKKTKKTETKKTEGSKKIPVGVQIISIFYYVVAGLCILIGFSSILNASTIVTMAVNNTPELAGILNRGMIIWVGVFMIAFSSVYFFVGRGLRKLKQWAKVLALILAGIGVVITIYSMITNFTFMQPVRFAIHVAIGGYLIFFKEAKGVFK